MKAKKSNRSPADLPESADDKKHLQQEETTIDLPDVKDIPGQEHVKVPPLREMADTTISSDDEEGKGLWEEEEDDEDINMDADMDVSPAEQKALREAAAGTPGEDDEALKRAKLDQQDEDGEGLNEKTSADGSDLDIPGSEDDDDDEEIGEEDEENNSYSLPSENEDDSISKE